MDQKDFQPLFRQHRFGKKQSIEWFVPLCKTGSSSASLETDPQLTTMGSALRLWHWPKQSIDQH